MTKILATVWLSISGAWLMSLPVWAQSPLCDARQVSTEVLPVLDSDCPIGEGLWGRRQPMATDSYFWIQCGLLDNPLSVEQAAVIYRQISSHVWMKPEGRATRCLIGPYDNHQQAHRELSQVSQLAAYGDAFVREIPRSAAKWSAQPIEIRRQVSLNGVHYQLPYRDNPQWSFYMEDNQPWNRLSYDQAQAFCQQQAMSLVNEQQWQPLLASQILSQQQWPLAIPYWGEGRKGLFASGEVTQLQGDSKLNVLCVKSVSQ